MILNDAHCHIINEDSVPSELSGRIICTTQPNEWDTILNLQNDRNFIAIGIHPWYTNKTESEWDTHLREILIANPSVMVGEIGLDKYHPDMPEQIHIFTIQLELATELRRPIHLHCVGAWDKILHILKAHVKKTPPAIIAHAFSGDPGIIEKLIEQYNMYFSYSTAYNNENQVSRIAATPLNRLLIESDTDTVTEEIEKLTNAIETIASIRGLAPDELSEQINKNFLGVLSYVRPID